jgi:outer membrane protein assembly factor BamB
MARRLLVLCVLLAAAAALPGCGGDADDAPLPGERVPILDIAPALAAGDAPRAAPLPPARPPEDWPQVGGTPVHAPGHLALSEGARAALTAGRPAWAASIGAGADNRTPLIAQPVVAGGRVFTMDAGGVVRALDAANGREVWRTDARAGGAEADDAMPTGGLAAEGGRLFVTPGGAEAVALDMTTGAEVWRAPLPGPARAPPTPSGDLVFVATRDARVVALDAATGAWRWGHQGLQAAATLLSAAPPAVAGDIVIAALPGGEVTALSRAQGQPLWFAQVNRPGGARSVGPAGRLADVAAPLVLAPGGLVLALGADGPLAALRVGAGGAVAWSRPELRGAQMPWLAGSTVFALGADGTLAALEVSDGAVLWAQRLPVREEPDDPTSPRLIWHGPVLAGGQLLLTASDGRLAVADAADGALRATIDLGARVGQPPVVAGGRVYVLTAAGRLLAF